MGTPFCDEKYSLAWCYKKLGRFKDAYQIFLEIADIHRKNGYDAPSGIKYSDIVRSENIEHIAPRTPTDGNPLANGYGIYVDAVAPENGIESGQWLNSIGNLMLIAESHNKSIGDCRFADKLTSYEKSSLSQQREIKDFASNKDGMLIWDMEAIKKRKQSMIEAAMEIWSLDNI